MNLGEKLAWYRIKAGHTQDSLATASGASRQAIAKLERNKGGSPTLETLKKLLSHCKVTLEEFFRDPKNPVEPIKNRAFHEFDLMLRGPDGQVVQKLAGIISNGLSEQQQIFITNIEYRDIHLKLEQILKRGGFYALIAQRNIEVSHKLLDKPFKIFDDSMEPNYPCGEVIFLKPCFYPKNGNIVAVRIDDSEDALRVFHQHDKEITLTPINAAYPPRTYHSSQVYVYGVVFEVKGVSKSRPFEVGEWDGATYTMSYVPDGGNKRKPKQKKIPAKKVKSP